MWGLLLIALIEADQTALASAHRPSVREPYHFREMEVVITPISLRLTSQKNIGENYVSSIEVGRDGSVNASVRCNEKLVFSNREAAKIPPGFRVVGSDLSVDSELRCSQTVGLRLYLSPIKFEENPKIKVIEIDVVRGKESGVTY